VTAWAKLRAPLYAQGGHLV